MKLIYGAWRRSVKLITQVIQAGNKNKLPISEIGKETSLKI